MLEISELRDKKIFSRKVGVTCEVCAESSQSSLIPRCRNMGHMNLVPVEFLQFFHGQLGGRVASLFNFMDRMADALGAPVEGFQEMIKQMKKS